MEGIVNFGPNVASFFLTSVLRRWYVVVTYVPPHDAQDVRRIEQVLKMAPEGMEVIMLGDLKNRLREPREYREDKLPTALSGSGMMDVTANFTPRQRNQGMENWT